jgi:hypothetical protein
MLITIGLALAAAQLAPAAGEPQVCRQTPRRSDLTLFRYKKQKVCKTEAEWRAADARQSRANTLDRSQLPGAR